MTRLASLLALTLLAGCAAPVDDAAKGVDAPVILAEPAVIEAAPVATATTCEDGGDGIGGTGCPVD